MFYFFSDIKLPWDNYFEVKIKIVHANTFLPFQSTLITFRGSWKDAKEI